MACLYCGGDVPLRMRLTGEDRFCCPEHKRLYNEEHTRIGLARLLEEAGAKPATQPKSAETVAPTGRDADEVSEADENALPEPELVSSGGGLRLWLFPHLAHRPAPRFQGFLAPEPEPVAYAPAVEQEPPVEAEQPGRREQAAAVEVVEAPPGPPPAKPPSPPERSTPKSAPAGKESKKGAAPRRTKSEAPSKAAGPEPDKKEPDEKKTSKDASGTEEIALPAFQAYEQSGGRPWLRIAAAVVLTLAAGGGGYYWYKTSPAPALPAQAPQTERQLWEEWIPHWARSAGGEEIALFGPSLGWTDYRVQWRANPDEEVAWVYRAADPRNYYVLRLELTRYGTWKVVRYALIDGRRTEAEERILSKQLPDERRVAVQLEVRGSQFRLYVDGHNVASWQDERLTRGGFGVMRPDAGLAGLGNVTVTELRGNSVQEGRLWKKLHRERLPEVTLLGQTREPPIPPRISAGESEL